MNILIASLKVRRVESLIFQSIFHDCFFSQPGTAAVSDLQKSSRSKVDTTINNSLLLFGRIVYYLLLSFHLNAVTSVLSFRLRKKGELSLIPNILQHSYCMVHLKIRKNSLFSLLLLITGIKKVPFLNLIILKRS